MKRFFKWLGIVFGILLVVIVVFISAVYLISNSRLNKKFEIKAETIKIPKDELSIKKGRHLVLAVGKCSGCHGNNLAGKIVYDDPAVGRLVSANLTGGGKDGRLSDKEFVIAFRLGINPKTKKTLIFMPSYALRNFSDKDLGSIIAYLKTLKPIEKKLPVNTIGPIARFFYLQGKYPLSPAQIIEDDPIDKPVEPEHGTTAAYGKYLIDTGGCRDCHGEDLAGGPIAFAPPGTPTPQNLTRSGDMKNWSEDDFKEALRKGIKPSGVKINQFMPWKETKFLTDDEIKATWRYLRSVSSK